MADHWVVNASPVIVLDRIGQLGLLEKLAPNPAIPEGVVHEISRGSAPIASNKLTGFQRIIAQAIDPIVAGWDLGPLRLFC